MIEFRLHRDKLTDNKIRWNASVEGVQFKLYIPKWRVPDPTPDPIYVTIEKAKESEEPTVPGIRASPSKQIRTIVRFVSEHTETIRYRPSGDPQDWELGEPYVPKSLLLRPWPVQIAVIVQWSNE